MFEELEKWSTLKQQVLPFDFWEEEKNEEQKQIDQLPYYPEPVNDNQRLFNLQKDYYKGREKALDEMFLKFMEIAPKIINIEKDNGCKRTFTKSKINEMALDATCLFIQQIKKNRLIIKTSFIAYLRLQVLKVMNTHTKGMDFEKYCIKNKINLFELSELEKQKVKREFELMRRLSYMTETEVNTMCKEAQELTREFPVMAEREQKAALNLFKHRWHGIEPDEAIRICGGAV